jgi:hypothetical protein
MRLNKASLLCDEVGAAVAVGAAAGFSGFAGMGAGCWANAAPDTAIEAAANIERRRLDGVIFMLSFHKQ